MQETEQGAEGKKSAEDTSVHELESWLEGSGRRTRGWAKKIGKE